MRSRHCKDEPAFIHVTGEIWEGESEAMSPSQENCLFDNHRYVPTSDRKGIGVCWFQCFFGVPFNKKPYVSLLGGTFFVGTVRCFSVWFRVEKEAHICRTKRLQRMLNAIY